MALFFKRGTRKIKKVLCQTLSEGKWMEDNIPIPIVWVLTYTFSYDAEAFKFTFFFKFS